MKLVDWIARTAMLVLASLATLALIGSLASVSDSRLGDAFPGAVERPATDESRTTDETPSIADPSAPPSGDTIERPTGVADASPPADRGDEVARWLKALTYAVLALAVFAAAGVVALARIASHLGRIAGR